MRFCFFRYILAYDDKSEHGMRVTLQQGAEEQSQGEVEIVIELQPRSYR